MLEFVIGGLYTIFVISVGIGIGKQMSKKEAEVKTFGGPS